MLKPLQGCRGFSFFCLLDEMQSRAFYFLPLPICSDSVILFITRARTPPYNIYIHIYIQYNTYICIYIKYDIHINTIILSCKSIKQYRHTDTTPFIQKTNTAKNNRVYDDFNYMHPISKLEN